MSVIFRTFIALVITCFLSCTKQTPCNYTEQNLISRVNVEGLKDTLSFNDTLWISVEIPKIVSDSNSEQVKRIKVLLGKTMIVNQVFTK